MRMANVLIVEDNRDLNSVYRIILERDGHTVQSAFDGKEGLQCLASLQPDIILLDLIMPHVSGVEFLRQANLRERMPATKVLVFTNLDHGNEMNAAMEIGVYKCAIKARTTPDGLVKVVRAMLSA